MRVKNGTTVMPAIHCTAATTQKATSGHNSGFQTSWNPLSTNALDAQTNSRESGPYFQDGFRPRLDNTMREHGKGDQHTDARTNHTHFFGATGKIVHVVHPHRAAELVIEALAGRPCQLYANQMGLRPRREVSLLEGPGLRACFVGRDDLQTVPVLWIEDLKSHAAVGGNLVRAQIGSKTIVRSGRYQGFSLKESGRQGFGFHRMRSARNAYRSVSRRCRKRSPCPTVLLVPPESAPESSFSNPHRDQRSRPHYSTREDGQPWSPVPAAKPMPASVSVLGNHMHRSTSILRVDRRLFAIRTIP